MSVKIISLIFSFEQSKPNLNFAEIIVYSDSIAHHLINGKTVLTYTNLRYGDDGRLPENMIHKKNQKLSEGYISLQSESHPIKFRNIRIKSLN